MSDTRRSGLLAAAAFAFVACASVTEAQVEIRDVTTSDPYSDGDGCDSTSGNGQIPQALQSVWWKQSVRFVVANGLDRAITASVQAQINQYTSQTTVHVSARSSISGSLNVRAGCAAYTMPQVRVSASILSYQEEAAPQGDLGALNAEVARLESAVRSGGMSAADATRALDAAAVSNRIPQSQNWISFRNQEWERFSSLERARRAGLQQQASDQARLQQQASQQQANAEQQRRDAEQQKMRQQQEAQKMQQDAAAARAELQRRGEEMARQKKEELDRQLQQLQQRQQAVNDATAASQQAAWQAANEGPRISEDVRYRGERSEMVTKIVEDWSPGKRYASSGSAAVTVADPFSTASAESNGVPGAKAPLTALRLEPSDKLEIKALRGRESVAEVTLVSDVEGVNPTILGVEGTKGVSAVVVPLPRTEGLALVRFEIRVTVSAGVPVGSLAATVRVGTGLGFPSELVIGIGGSVR